MTLRRSRDLRNHHSTATRVQVEADNLLPSDGDGEHVSVIVREGRITVAVAAPGRRFADADVDPDLARTLGTALLAAARVAERSGR